jgi:glycosyltransferase involved in cell wall biosynthesis
LFDDNIYQPDFVQTAWDALQRSGADVVHSNVHMFAKEGKDFLLGGWPLTLELLRNLNTIPNGGVMVRRSFFDRYGMYDPHVLMRRICDWDLWLRALTLGARFCHVDRVGAVEYGLVSENSIGNTVAWDVKVAYGYMLDEARLPERAAKLRPRVIGNYDVLDPSVIRQYVRDGREWSELVDTVYTPFLARHDANGFDPTFPGNRAAALDPHQGWNAGWSLIGNRRRYLVVSNTVNAWTSTWTHALRKHPGAIVINCPEWQLASFRPEDLDLIVLLDCTSSGFLKPQLDAFNAASVPIVYVLGYGDQTSNAVPLAVSDRHFAGNSHIAALLGHDFYFPQMGVRFPPVLRDGARLLADQAYAAVVAGADADRFGSTDPLLFPFDGVAVPASKHAPPTSRIAYETDPINNGAVDERIAFRGATHAVRNGEIVRSSWEGVGALAECRPGSHIVVDANVLDAAPLAERVGLAALAERHDVALIPNPRPSAPNSREASPAPHASPRAWQEWIGNLALCTQLARHIAQARRAGARRPSVGIFLNSEMFSGSEIYGAMIARALATVGARVRVFIPETSAYGADSDAGPLDKWLLAHGIPVAAQAPYKFGAGYLGDAPADQHAALARLSAFVAKLDLDVILCAGFMPTFADLAHERCLLFMALLQPSAYEQRQLACLRGKVSGILSDSQWSLAAHQRLLAAPGAVVRSILPLEDGAPEPAKTPGTSGAIRIALGGTLQPRKRQLEAIKAVALLRDRGLSIELNIYGYQLNILQAYLDEIHRTIADLHLRDQVVCHGLDAMHHIAAANDVVLSASIDESLPQTLAELMRMGLIGVACLSGGIDELIEDGRTGYLTSDFSPEGLADVLERAIRDRGRWPEISAQARQRIEREHSAEVNTAALLNLMIESAQLERSPYGRLADVP